MHTNSTFCPDPFYDPSVTWDTDNPNVTQCLLDTLLSPLPGALLLTASIIESVTGKHGVQSGLRERGRRRPSVWFLTKAFLNIVLILNGIASLAFNSHMRQYASFILGQLSLEFSYIIALGKLIADWKRERWSSGPLLIFWWILAIFVAAPTFKLQLEVLLLSRNPDDDGEWLPTLILAITFFPVALLQAILQCFPDRPNGERHPTSAPEESASLPSKLTFSWMCQTMRRGYRGRMTLDDVPNLPQDLTTETTLIQEWHTKIMGGRRAGIWRLMLTSYKWDFLGYMTVGIVHYAMWFIQPYFLKLLVNHISSDTEEAWKGYFYAVLLFVGSTLWTVTFHQYCFLMLRLSVKMRATLASLIYRKVLSMTPSSRRRFNTGDVVNFISVDCDRIIERFPFANFVWATPFSCALASFLLYTELGAAATVVGIATLVALQAPASIFGGRAGERLQKDVMDKKDERVRMVGESLMGMKVIKLMAWEPCFAERIGLARGRETSTIARAFKLLALVNVSFSVIPYVVTIVSFGVFCWVNGEDNLTADKIFVSLSLFNIIKFLFTLFPASLMDAIKLHVSFDRIKEFLDADEIHEDAIQMDQQDDEDVAIRNGNFSWSEDTDCLTDINLDVPRGSFVAVVGSVGSGKTSLLNGILGNMEKGSGDVSVQGSIAYVPQTAWIRNQTVMDNVLFNNVLMEERYQQVVEACALTADLGILPAGSRTEIGENGINLSGGQKQRLSLARAVYCDADVYILDDPLSAVDMHVAKHIFENVLSTSSGLLKRKTRILVTNRLSYLDRVDKIVIMKDGKIAEQGSYKELMKNSSSELPKLVSQKEIEVSGEAAPKKSTECVEKEPDGMAVYQADTDDEDARLVQDEDSAGGHVGFYVYVGYVKNFGVAAFLALLIFYAVGQSLQAATGLLLAKWADSNDVKNTNGTWSTEEYLGLYAGLALSDAGLQFLREVSLLVLCCRVAKRIHDTLLDSVFRSPMSFFDQNPTGRVLNRFSSDVNAVDQTIPNCLAQFLSCTGQVLMTIVLVSYTVPLVVLLLLPLMVLYAFLQRYYTKTSSLLRRMTFVTMSPVISHFTESIQGATSIRAYRQQQNFVQDFEEKVETNSKCFYLSVSANRWLGFWIETMGNTVVLGVAVFALLGASGGGVSAGMAGLAITYALNITDTLNWLLRVTGDLETNSVSYERILEYTDNEHEADWDVPEVDDSMSVDWPSRGQISLRNYETRYRPGLDLVLKDVSFDVRPGEKVGICGRTGAGKSSLTLALFRILEPVAGDIIIDDANISGMGLHRLRRGMTVIPQDPVLFEGTLRQNLDPRNASSDRQLWRALEHAHLKQHVREMQMGLDSHVEEGGANFSVGQRQLICLARALLRKTKILVLDEATASVDNETDRLIQETIRREFSQCTVLTIAHRLDTIMDYDRVAVFSHGRLQEFDAPQVLLSDPRSEFKALVDSLKS